MDGADVRRLCEHVVHVLPGVGRELIEREFAFRPGDVEGVRRAVAAGDNLVHLRFEEFDDRFHGAPSSARLACLLGKAAPSV